MKTKEAIVEAAFRLISEHGIKSTSLAMIATEVGISKPAIYYHFSSKEELIDHLFDYAAADYRFLDYFPIDEYKEENFTERLVNDGIAFFSEYNADSPTLRIVNEFVLSASLQKKYEKKLKDMVQGFLDGFESLLTHGSELGVVSPEKITVKARILALVIDNIGNYRMMDIKSDDEEIWRTTVNYVVKGGE